MSKDYKLTIELVPSTSWYSNVRSNVSKSEWDKIRKKSYKLANYKCEICGDNGLLQGHKHPVECHEIWDYNDITNKQTLIGLKSLCPNCHKAKYIGLAQIKGEEYIVISQLMKVNELSMDESKSYISDSFTKWRERSNKKWTVDITYLDNFLGKSFLFD